MALAATLPVPEPAYHRREPERSPLHTAIRSHLASFLEACDPPAFVARAFRHFLDCGLLARGFVRVRCDRCRQECLVAFSCKDRSFCPSCTARRAAATAAHLVDSVLPQAPYRQFVLVMPFDLHHRLARDPALESRALALFVEELTTHLREATDADETAQPGTVTFLQHFGSTLNLHVHFHLLALDGVYENHGDRAPLAFARAPTPTVEQLHRLVERAAKRIRALAAQEPPASEPSEVQAPLLRVFGAEPAAPSEPKLVAQFDGFNLHAGTSFEPQARVALERFCRYALRGPLAQARLSQRSDGKLVYRLKAPKPDGTTHVVFTPLTLLQRLSWLVPLPRIHLTRYHGVFAPAHPWRSRVVPSPPEDLPPLACVRKSRWLDWADLLKRVFALEVLACVCGGRRRVLSVIKDERVARRILDHLGLPSHTLPLADAAQEPQGALWPTGPPADEHAQPPAPDDFDQRCGTIDFAE